MTQSAGKSLEQFLAEFRIVKSFAGRCVCHDRTSDLVPTRLSIRFHVRSANPEACPVGPQQVQQATTGSTSRSTVVDKSTSQTASATSWWDKEQGHLRYQLLDGPVLGVEG